MKWIMREWEADQRGAPDEEWTVEWMSLLPNMELALEILKLEDIHPQADLMSVEEVQTSLKGRVDEREEGLLRKIVVSV